MNSGQQPTGGLYENGIGWMILLAVMAGLLWLFWMYFDVEVREMVRWIRYSEMYLISFFVSDDYMIRHASGEFRFTDGFEATPGYAKDELSYTHLSMFSSLAMQPLKIPFIIMLSIAAFWCMFRGPNTQFKTTMDLEKFIERQSHVFPVISPFAKFNPSTQPPRPPGAPVPVELPLFAEALGPEEWLAYENIQIPDGKIDEESAGKSFIVQLGRPWRGPKALEDYKQILLASFCLKASRKRGECDDMLGRLAQCWSFKDGLKLSKDSKLLGQARKILGDSELSGNMMKQINRHGFETTAMLRALQYAREEGGVLAPAEFVWLRAHDRVLWYPLNNMGRQSFHMEALGAMSHFKAEKMTQRPIPVPKIENAIRTIKEYMSSARARPIPQLDYSQSKKRGIKKAV